MTTPFGLTPSQTVGPFFADALLRDVANVLVGPQSTGERIRIEGRVLDGDGLPVADAMVEIWQANAHGRYNHPLDQVDAPLEPDFTGFGRSGTDAAGRFVFETVKPGAVSFDSERWQAPHVNIVVFARGLLNHLATRLYFEDEPANATDPILALVPAERRGTLLARREETGDGLLYLFDVRLQGEAETVFFDV